MISKLIIGRDLGGRSSRKAWQQVNRFSIFDFKIDPTDESEGQAIGIGSFFLPPRMNPGALYPGYFR